MNRPHPFGKGRGRCGCILACEGAVALVVEPTSLNRGEGLVDELACDARIVEGERVVVERWW